MAIDYLVRVSGGGNHFLSWIRVLRFDYSLVTRVSSTSCGSFSEPAVFVHFWLRQCRMVLRPHLYCVLSRFTIVRYLYWVLGLFGVSPVFSVAFALIVRTIPATVLVLALRCAADVAVFSPIPLFFALVLGISVLAYEILALPLLFLGYAYGVAFFAPSACSPLIPILR